MTEGDHEHTNRLIDETSPYLLQHAHNPVDWFPWGEEALEKAQKENKLLLVSVGYSACHWCHVMERESFESDSIADYMNEHFVCIKVDREERPDIDQIYMDAVQLITQRGGWPLNCFALPDGKPFYGGTYFPADQWMNVMRQVNKEYTTNPDKVLEYATQLTEGVQTSELIPKNTAEAEFDIATLDEVVDDWKPNFDNRLGGPNRAPKFPLPNNYQFLMRYAHYKQDKSVMKHVVLTLDQMAFGGIYDQLGGGFARYSTDERWKVPHFEKMLYDNAQLVSLYSEGYQHSKNPLYKQVVDETLEFVERELMAKNGAFFSALDADSEGEEGKFYVWTEAELQAELTEDEYKVFADYYNINAQGFWEHENYILLRNNTSEQIAKQHDMSEEDLAKLIDKSKAKLMKVRDKRIRPGLDDKSLTSWNALMLKGYVDAYQAFGDKHYLEVALNNANFIANTQRRDDGGLFHNYKDGRTTINAYLEDYCHTIEAFVALYQATFDEQWLNTARELADYSIKHFHDAESGMFYFTSDLDKALVARKQDIRDNVIPGSNSSMARGLLLLGHYFDEPQYIEISDQMLNNIRSYMPRYGSGYSNWGMLLLDHVWPLYEIAISGKDAHDARMAINERYIPNKMFIGSTEDSQLPLLELKYVKGETMIYVCLNKVCNMPVTDVNEALKQIK